MDENIALKDQIIPCQITCCVLCVTLTRITRLADTIISGTLLCYARPISKATARNNRCIRTADSHCGVSREAVSSWRERLEPDRAWRPGARVRADGASLIADLLIIVLSTRDMNLTGRDNVGSADRFGAKFLIRPKSISRSSP